MSAAEPCGPGRGVRSRVPFRPYLFQVAVAVAAAQARRCCVPRSSAAASRLPRSLRLGELMNLSLRRVRMVPAIAPPKPAIAPRPRRRLEHGPERDALSLTPARAGPGQAGGVARARGGASRAGPDGPLANGVKVWG